MKYPCPMKITAAGVSVYYGTAQALFDIDLRIPAGHITALIGPSGSGKSTFLRLINRLNDLIPGARTEGRLCIDEEDIYAPGANVPLLRKRVGMVFQKSNPFPRSIFDNVAYGPRMHGVSSVPKLAETVERSLRRAELWDEVKDRLRQSAFSLSGGQQQRLCIARALAVDPEILLMDEPTSALDPRATARIEALVTQTLRDLTLVIVTHNMQQAARIADLTAFFYEGRLVEFAPTPQLFGHPVAQETQEYLAGQFG